MVRVLSGRYPAGERPLDWEKRRAGEEIIATVSGEEIRLYSSAMQSTPAPGWQVLLTADAADSEAAPLRWTLYGIAPAHPK